ncbi:response regulator [Rhodobacteraceae bacterium D3-12]|nr:response regulator [Rhodobacteraceae bacterium D3-12]
MTYQGKDKFQRKLELRARKTDGFRILIVDDEPSILELVKTALETLEGYEVFCAGNATDALDIVEKEQTPFDCFLLDIQMPDVDGIELLCELREIPEYYETPILMLTAMSDRKYIDEAFLEGATDYVNKPFDFLELHSRIQCANSMVELRRASERNMECANEIRRKLKSVQEFSLEEPISIKGYKQILRYVEFDNYVNQLARGKMIGTQAMSVMLQDADIFFESAGCDSFRDAIEDVAAVIQDALNDLHGIFSYRGNGVFMVILHNPKDVAALHGTAKLSDVFKKQTMRHVTDPRVSVLVGEPVAMSPLLPRGANGALQKSLANVQRLERDLRRQHDAGHHKVHADVDDTEHTNTKRMYEHVLHELFGEESYRKRL